MSAETPYRSKFFLLAYKEEEAVIKWLKSRKVQRLVKKGAQFAVVFTRCEIGVTITATVKAPDGTILSENVTDYTTW